MSIRPMTPVEIVAGLRRAAVVCVEQQREDWVCVDVCRADATLHAAWDWLHVWDEAFAGSPDHAAFFLLLCAEANDAA